MNNQEQCDSSLDKLKHSLIRTVIVKIVETILQMRIDVKSEQTDRFQLMVDQLRKNKDPSEGLLEQFLATIIKKDQHEVHKNILQSNDYHQEMTIEFNFFNKKTQRCQIFEVWKAIFLIEKIQMISLFSKGSQEVHQIRYFFKDLIEELITMPIWKKYWGDNINRKFVKQTCILNYKVKYCDIPLPKFFHYDEKRQKFKKFPAFTVNLKVFFKEQVQSLEQNTQGNMQKKEIQKNSAIKKVSESSNGNSKKYSIYSYEEDEIDIIFISSDAEFSPSSENIKQIQIMPVDQQSDSQYVMLVEEKDDPKKSQFLDQIEKLKQKIKKYDQALD